MIDVSKAKWTFSLCGALLMAFPFFAIVPFVAVVGWAIYAVPVLVLVRILAIPEATFLHANFLGGFPKVSGFLVIVPFWLIVGAFTGFAMFRIRQAQYLKKNNPALLKFGRGAVILTFAAQVLVGVLGGAAYLLAR